MLISHKEDLSLSFQAVVEHSLEAFLVALRRTPVNITNEDDITKVVAFLDDKPLPIATYLPADELVYWFHLASVWLCPLFLEV